MKNNFVKVSIIGILLIILIGVVIYSKMFIIGSKDFSSIDIDKVTVGNNEVTIKGIITDSGRAFKDYSYTQVGNELYVTIKSVVVSKKNNSGNFEIKIPVSGMNVDTIQLSDDKSTKVIYSKNME